MLIAHVFPLNLFIKDVHVQMHGPARHVTTLYYISSITRPVRTFETFSLCDAGDTYAHQ